MTRAARKGSRRNSAPGAMGAPGNDQEPTRSPDEIRRIVRQREEMCRDRCPGWEIFEVNREPGVEIEACDECNQLARAVGEPQLTDDDVAALPEAQRALARALAEPQDFERNPALSDAQFVEEIQRLLYDEDPATVGVIQDMLLERQMTLVELSQRFTSSEDWHAGPWDLKDTTKGVFEVSRATPMVDHYVLPAHWASALINGDYSGLEGDDEAELERFLARRQPGMAVDVEDERFSNRNDAGTFIGGDVATYTFHKGVAGAEGVAWYATTSASGKKYFAHVEVHARGESFPAPTIGTFTISKDLAAHAGKRFDTRDAAQRFAVELAWRAAIQLKRSRDATIAHIRTDIQHHRMPGDVLPKQLLDGFDLTTRGDMPELKTNPPWVTNALADAFDSLSSQVPPEWLPKLNNARGGPKNTFVAELREYGCGAYGCVLPTLDAGVVLKVTTDETESEFAAELAADLVAPICVHYYMAVSLAAGHEKRPIYLLWREAADDVGKIGKVVGVDAQHYIDEQHKAAQELYLALRGASPVRILIDERIRAWEAACEEMGDAVPELETLAQGMLAVFRDQRVFFGDIHAGNVGRVFRGGEQGLWVITDPGHVAVLAPRAGRS